MNSQKISVALVLASDKLKASNFVCCLNKIHWFKDNNGCINSQSVLQHSISIEHVIIQLSLTDIIVPMGVSTESTAIFSIRIFYNSFFSPHFVPAASNFKPIWQRQAAWIIEIKEIYSLSHIKIYSLHSLMTLFHDLASGLWRNALVYTNQAFFIFFSTFLPLKCKKVHINNTTSIIS